MSARLVVALLVICAGVFPMVSGSLPDAPDVDIDGIIAPGNGEPIDTNASISHETKWHWYTDRRGDEIGQIQVRITNEGNETKVVRAHVHPVDRFGVYHNDKYYGPKVVRPGETVVMTKKWDREDQNINDWTDPEVTLEVCNDNIVMVKCKVVE